MEPLSALSLAAAIAQFIDLGSKLLHSTKEISETGSTVSTEHVGIIAKDLASINSGLQQVDSIVVSLSKEERARLDLSASCHASASELLDCLNRITLNSRKKDTWVSFRVAIKTIWSRDRIDSLMKRLSDFREQLSLRIMLLLNANSKLQNRTLDKLLESNREIVEIVTLNSKTLNLQLSDEHTRGISRQVQDRLDGERRHVETLAAILTTRDGCTRTITGPDYLTKGSDFDSETSTIRTTTTYREHHLLGDEVQGEVPDLESKMTANITKRIQDALHFRQISERRAAVPIAYQKTFDWIYQDSGCHNRKWDSLVDWLKCGQGCYWLSGKAGSGKSTLMKYLQENPATTRALGEWAKPSKLVIGSFYFWYAGTSLQKSQAGLLRSLLLNVLSQCPYLAIVLFPDLSRSLLSGEIKGHIEVSYIELTKAFQTLMSSTLPKLKICFFVDGIDEYEGERIDICEMFSQAESSTSVKILLSSRPIPACVAAFTNCPQLSLQYLTEGDIQTYVQDKLRHHPLLAQMEFTQRGATGQIIYSITSKASGVFLWVTLVVKLVIVGLQEFDTLLRLLQRIDDLPSDLEKLYDHMLGSMSPQNTLEGSKMLQLVLRSMLTQGEFPMTLLQLSFAVQDCRIAIVMEFCAMSPQEEYWRSESTQGRMRSRCCGLIEALDASNLGGDTSQRPVTFLHRTVVEFLQTDTIWRQVASKTEGTMFNVDEALMSSSLLEMKSKPPTAKQKEGLELPPCFRSMLRMLTYEKNMDHGKALMRNFYWDEMMRTMDLFWGSPATFSSSGSPFQSSSAGTTQSSRSMTLQTPFPLFLSAACQVPTEIFNILLEQILASLVTESSIIRRQLIAYLLISYADEAQVPRRIAFAKTIMASHLAPNHPISVSPENHPFWNDRWKHVLPSVHEWTPWEFILHYATDLTNSSDANFENFLYLGILESFCDIVISLVDQGANVHSILAFLSEDRSRNRNHIYMKTCERTSFAVLRHLLLRTWRRRASKAFGATQSSKDVAKANKTLAEKMCVLEDRMLSKKALLEMTTHPWDHRDMPNVATKRRDLTNRGIKSKHGNHFVSKPKPPTLAAEKKEATARDILVVVGSPWRNFQAPISDMPARKTQTGESNGQSNSRPRDYWDVTPRARRVELLEPEEQALAAQLARTDLTPRDQRMIQSKVWQLSPQLQSRVFECSQNLQQTLRDGAGH